MERGIPANGSGATEPAATATPADQPGAAAGGAIALELDPFRRATGPLPSRNPTRRILMPIEAPVRPAAAVRLARLRGRRTSRKRAMARPGQACGAAIDSDAAGAGGFGAIDDRRLDLSFDELLAAVLALRRALLRRVGVHRRGPGPSGRDSTMAASAGTTRRSPWRPPTRPRASSSTTWRSSTWMPAGSPVSAPWTTPTTRHRALEEERRLAYVAWTRARRSLTLVYDPAAPRRAF